jgi:hypothetical protein
MDDVVEEVRSNFRVAYKAYVDAGAALHRALCAEQRDDVPALQQQVTAAAGTYEQARSAYVDAVLSTIQAPLLPPSPHRVRRRRK